MKRSGVVIGSFAGVKIVLDYSWFLLVAVLMEVFIASLYKYAPHISVVGAVAVGSVMSALFVASVVVHELAHSVYANRSGLNVRRITLFVFGGVSEIEDEPKTPGQEAKIAAIGPLASVALAVLFGLLWYVGIRVGSDLLAVIGATLADMNLLLAVFNLFPGFPLDGGRILRALVWKLTGDIERATQVASAAGEALAALTMTYGAFLAVTMPQTRTEGMWIFLIGSLLYSAANQSYRLILVRLVLRNKRVKDFMVRGKKDTRMTPGTVTVKANDPAFQAAAGTILLQHQDVPVMGRNHIIGVFSRRKLDIYLHREMKRRHVSWRASVR